MITKSSSNDKTNIGHFIEGNLHLLTITYMVYDIYYIQNIG